MLIDKSEKEQAPNTSNDNVLRKWWLLNGKSSGVYVETEKDGPWDDETLFLNIQYVLS